MISILLEHKQRMVKGDPGKMEEMLDDEETDVMWTTWWANYAIRW